MSKTEHWTNDWDRISAQIAERPNLLLASDFDGTLSALAASPAEAVLPGETRTLLRRLATCPGVHVAIISGRSLEDLQMRVGILGLYYVGNHGLEVSGPGLELQNPQATQVQSELASTVAFLVEETAGLTGVFVENKGPSVAIHWRLASDEDRRTLQQIVRVAAENHPRLGLTSGKCVWELRPKTGWHKGDALSQLITRLRLVPDEAIYLGDDLTDEDAFSVVQNGLTFHVGGPDDRTAAQYRIRDAADARAFLLCVLGVRSKLHRTKRESSGNAAAPGSGFQLR